MAVTTTFHGGLAPGLQSSNILRGSSDPADGRQQKRRDKVPVRNGVSNKWPKIKGFHWGDFTLLSCRWFQILFIFTPNVWGNDPIWRAYFSDGWFNHHLGTRWLFVASRLLFFFFRAEVQRAESFFLGGEVLYMWIFLFKMYGFCQQQRMVGFMPLTRGLVGLANFLIPTASISLGGRMGSKPWDERWVYRLVILVEIRWHLWNVTKFWHDSSLIHSLTNG